MNLKTKNMAIAALCIWAAGVTTFLLFKSERSTPPMAVSPSSEGEKGKKDPNSYEAREIKNTLIKNAKIFQNCWLNLIKKTPKLEEAFVEMDWTISSEGKVSKPEIIRSRPDDAEMSSCMIKSFDNLDFPPPPTGKDHYVTHKFFFQKEGAEPKHPILVTTPTGK